MPLERISKADRVPVAAVFEVWLMTKRLDVAKTELEAYIPCKRSALKAYGALERRFRGVISESEPIVIPRYKVSEFQLIVLSKAFCWLVPVELSPRRMVKSPLWTVTDKAIGVAVVPVAVQRRFPLVAES